MEKQLASIYARVSSNQQKDEETIDSQIDTLIDYANKNGLSVHPDWIFKDEGFSGATLDRPGLDKLRDLIRENSLNCIIVYSPDRLARRYVNQLILEEEFSKFAVKVIYFKGAKNETPEDKLLKHFQGIFAEYERSQILDRSRRGKLYKARQGDKNILVQAPFGYNTSREAFYAIDNQKAPIVKEIFYLYTREGYSLSTIALHLEKKGISPPRGGQKWDVTSIRGMLRNPAYTGTAYYGKTEKSDGDSNRIVRYSVAGKFVRARKPKKSKPIEQWYPIPVPAIIAQNEFELAQELLKKNKERASRNTKVPTILQGLLVCGCCGRSYYKRSYKTSSKKRTSYYCHSQLNKKIKWCGNPKVNQEELDSIVWSEIMKLIENPKLIENEIQRRIDENPKKTEIKDREKEMEKEIRRVKNAQDKLLDAYQDTECLGLKELKKRMQALKSKEKELQKELESIKASSLMKEKQASLNVTINEFRRQLSEKAENLDIKNKQKIIRLLIEDIVVLKGEITINHSIPLSFNENCRLYGDCVQSP